MKKQAVVSQKITKIYLAFMAGIFLLWPGVNGYSQIMGAKKTMFYAGTLVFFVAFFLINAELQIVGYGKNSGVGLKETVSPADLFVLAYWVFSAVSTILSSDSKLSFWGGQRADGLFTITLYCLIYFLTAHFSELDARLLVIFDAAMVLCSILAFVQLSGSNPFGLYPEGMNYYDAFKKYAGEFLGTIGNVDLLAGILCIAIPCNLFALILLPGKKKYLFLIPLGCSLGLLIGSRVDSAFVGTFCGILFSLPLLADDKKKRKLLAIILVIVILAGLAALYFFGSDFGGFIYEASQILHGNFDDSFGSGRIYIWKEVLKIVPDKPLFGGGPETLQSRVSAYFERYDENLEATIHTDVDTAHNNYLNILVNQGLFALISYLGILAASITGWIKSHDKICFILGSSILCFSIQIFFGISSLIVDPYFWIFLGLLQKRLTDLKFRKQ